jgi:hypothetical protein
MGKHFTTGKTSYVGKSSILEKASRVELSSQLGNASQQGNTSKVDISSQLEPLQRLSEHKYLEWLRIILVKIWALSYCNYVAFHVLIFGRVCVFENDSSGKVYRFS